MFRLRLQFFRTFLLLTDLVLLTLAWLLAYHLRLTSGLIPVWKGIPPLEAYLFPLLYLLPIWGLTGTWYGLYHHGRSFSLRVEGWQVCKVASLSIVLFTATSYLVKLVDISRLVLAIFWATAVVLLLVSRALVPGTLRRLRRRRSYLRRVLLVGTGDLAHRVIKKIQEHSEAGLTLAGVLAENPGDVGCSLDGIEVIGMYDLVGSIIQRERIDSLIIALPFRAYEALEHVLAQVENEPIEVMLVPDLSPYMTLRSGIEDLAGIPAVTLQGFPLYGWNSVFKRVLDLSVSLSALLVFSPLLGMIAILIKVSSQGSVLYRQQRMGLDCQPFTLLKFRSMRTEAEAAGTPAWTRKNDPRRTWIGALLRRTSLDELPQLVNVLRGEMSLVGPRPERSEFIEEFRLRIPRYMLRHKIQAGMTGWAQIHGYRGDTSIEERLRYDLEYIQHWSLPFDLKILALTLVKGFFHKNAY
jgi:Undecaprenyl-phosphate glucose phosphotransferase